MLSYGARHYDPTLRQFISLDPLRFEGAADAIAGANLLQPYVYAGADPVTNRDVDGKLPAVIWLNTAVQLASPYVARLGPAAVRAGQWANQVGQAALQRTGELVRLGWQGYQVAGPAMQLGLRAGMAEALRRSLQPMLSKGEDGKERNAARAGGKSKAATGTTKETVARKSKGGDGATSRHVVEKQDGDTISVTHQVDKDGKTIHQHQTHIGREGARRQFPDEWTGTETIE